MTATTEREFSRRRQVRTWEMRLARVNGRLMESLQERRLLREENDRLRAAVVRKDLKIAALRRDAQEQAARAQRAERQLARRQK